MTSAPIRRRGRVRAGVCLPLAALLGWPAAVAGLGPAVVQGTLPNGAALLVSEQRNLPMVLVRVVLDAGSRRDPAGQAGLANLTAELLTEGTQTRTAQQIKETIDFVGGSLGAAAEMDYAVVSLRVLRKDLDVGLDLLADVLLRPAFRADELARRREAVLASLRAQEDDPTTVAQKAFQRALYGDTPYGHSADGFEATVATVDRNDVVRFFGSHFGPARAGVVIVGDLDAAAAHDHLSRVLADWRGDGPPAFVYPAFAAPTAQTVRVDRPVTQAGIVLGNLGIARANPDYEAVSVMNYVLGGGGFSSRLMDNIRTRGGLAYSVGSFFAASKDPGPFEIVMQTKTASVAEAIDRARREVERIRGGTVTEEELEEAKRYLTGSFPLRLDSNAKIADFIAQAWFYGLGMDYADVYIRKVNAVTAADVLRVAQAYIHPDRFIEVVVTNAAEGGSRETGAPAAPPPAH